MSLKTDIQGNRNGIADRILSDSAIAQPLLLDELTIENFKGIRALAIRPAGSNLNIYGDNAVGKTTIADAYSWLLFGKDSAGQADFNIKPIDGKTGEEIHNLTTSVEGKFSLADGSKLTLKKSYFEKWETKRGSNKQSFSGHKKSHWVNSVPVTETEFQLVAASLMNERLFRVLSEVRYFNEGLKWDVRRQMLIEAFGDVSDDEVIASDQQLSPLPEILEGLTIDQFKKRLAERRKAVNDELKTIPTQINENQRMLVQPAEGTEFIDVGEILEAVREDLSELQQQEARIKAGGEIAEIRKQIAECEAEKLQIRNRLSAEANRDFDARQELLRQKSAKRNEIQSEITRIESIITTHERLLANNAEALKPLKAKYDELKSMTFEARLAKECAACGQPLPAEQIEAARAKAEGEFNAEKARRLEANIAEGKQLMTSINQSKAVIELSEAKLKPLRAQLAEIDSEIASLKEVAGSKIEIDPLTDEEFATVNARQQMLEHSLAEIAASNEGLLREISDKILLKQSAIADLEKKIAELQASSKAQQRIKELEEREISLAQTAEECERHLFLIERFLRTRADLLNAKINSHFHLASFAMLDYQINEGVRDVCECTNKRGVPYSSTNNADRINLGLDIINAFARKYQFAPPVFIDGAESVTEIIPTAGQQIRLIVSASDKTLRVESTLKE